MAAGQTGGLDPCPARFRLYDGPDFL